MAAKTIDETIAQMMTKNEYIDACIPTAEMEPLVPEYQRVDRLWLIHATYNEDEGKVFIDVIQFLASPYYVVLQLRSIVKYHFGKLTKSSGAFGNWFFARLDLKMRALQPPRVGNLNVNCLKIAT